LKNNDIAARIEALTVDQVHEFYFDWRLWARDEQLPPVGDWTTWLLMGGRGAGKTRAGAEWVRGIATGGDPVSPVALVGETLEQARAVMIEGPSGLLAIAPPTDRPHFDRGRHLLRWPNGAEAQLMAASDPERLRGPQFAAAWADEAAKWPNAELTWDMLQFALRLGKRPRQMVTTTPRPTRLIKRLLAERQTVATKMPTADNAANLAPAFLGTVVERYRGTRLGRQELDGELIEDRADALWRRDLIEVSRCRRHDRPERIVVAVDPAVSSGKRSDACGIVVAGRIGDGAIILADRTLKPAPPMGWARRVVAVYEEFEADAVLAETNQGGDLVTSLIAQADPLVPVIKVHATRGKWLRAEPVAALYERGMVRHAPGLAELEDEMCAFGPDGLAEGHSPDRVDALVWSLTELMLRGSRPRVRSL